MDMRIRLAPEHEVSLDFYVISNDGMTTREYRKSRVIMALSTTIEDRRATFPVLSAGCLEAGPEFPFVAQFERLS